MILQGLSDASALAEQTLSLGSRSPMAFRTRVLARGLRAEARAARGMPCLCPPRH